jgi:hypothetical protein
MQIVSCGIFSEFVDDYADGGLNAYWCGCCLLYHLPNKPGRFDVLQVSLERLKEKF